MAVSFDVWAHDLMHRWQVRMLEDPWRFNQFESPDPFGDSRHSSPYLQHDRETVAHSLLNSFEKSTDALGFFPQPTYTVDKIIQIRPNQDWRKDTFTVGQAHLLKLGVQEYEETKDTGPSSADIFNDDDIHDTAIVTTNSNDFDDQNDLRIFYRGIHTGLRGGTDRQFRIPIEQVVFSSQSTSVSLYIQRANTVVPTLFFDSYKDGMPIILNPTTSSNFVASVNLTIESTNTDEAVKLLSVKRDGGELEIIETPVLAEVSHPAHGEFVMGKDENDPEYTPYAIKVSYLSGFPLGPHGHMNAQLEDAIIQLTNTNLSMRNLPFSHFAYASWSDVNESVTDNSGRTPPEFQNPLGSKVGHVRAWAIFEQFADGIKGKIKNRNIVY